MLHAVPIRSNVIHSRIFESRTKMNREMLRIIRDTPVAVIAAGAALSLVFLGGSAAEAITMNNDGISEKGTVPRANESLLPEDNGDIAAGLGCDALFIGGLVYASKRRR